MRILIESEAHRIYQTRLAMAEQQRDHMHRRWSMWGNLRLVIAVVALFLAWQAWSEPTRIMLVALVTVFIVFLLLAWQQRLCSQQRSRNEIQAEINRRALARLNHHWQALPLPVDPHIDHTHAYAYDLNVVGTASIAQRIGTPVTPFGWHALYMALLADQDMSDLRQRQRAITDLSQQLDVRQHVEAAGYGEEEVPDPAELLDWCRAPGRIGSRTWQYVLAAVAPILVVIGTILALVGVLNWSMLIGPIIANAMVFAVPGLPAQKSLRRVVVQREAITRYAHMMQPIATSRQTDSMLSGLAEQLGIGSDALSKLARLANSAIPPASLLYYPMQLLFQWDLHLAFAMEKWKDAHGDRTSDWLHALGEWEALAALSVLSHDYPDWIVPNVDTAHTLLHTEALAHPLLSPDVAIQNDVNIGPKGHFLFVTGSNMSGKSTLLRAIGLNVVLAQAGAVVCAAAFRMPPLRVSSCMRVEDSLEAGVSFFMAELIRLKSVVDRCQQQQDRQALFLLDEILQGTNTAERQVASRQVLQQLISLKAFGAVSSHDLELLVDSSLQNAATSVHFSEQYAGSGSDMTMSFDYKLHPGLATSSNAIRLMEMLGFQVTLQPQEPPNQ